MNTKKKLIRSKENLEELAWKLHRLCSFLDDTFKINYGGCCYIAYCIADLLEKDEVPYSLVIYDCSCDRFEEIDCSQFHYAIQCNDTIINGFDDVSYKIFEEISAKELKEHYKECTWNRVYNTLYNRILFNIIKRFYGLFSENLREK